MTQMRYNTKVVTKTRQVLDCSRLFQWSLFVKVGDIFFDEFINNLRGIIPLITRVVFARYYSQ